MINFWMVSCSWSTFAAPRMCRYGRLAKQVPEADAADLDVVSIEVSVGSGPKDCRELLSFHLPSVVSTLLLVVTEVVITQVR